MRAKVTWKSRPLRRLEGHCLEHEWERGVKLKQTQKRAEVRCVCLGKNDAPRQRKKHTKYKKKGAGAKKLACETKKKG